MLHRGQIEDLFIELRKMLDNAEQLFINREEIKASARVFDLELRVKRLFNEIYERNKNQIEGRGPDQGKFEFPHPLETGDGSLRDLIYSRNRNR